MTATSDPLDFLTSRGSKTLEKKQKIKQKKLL